MTAEHLERRRRMPIDLGYSSVAVTDHFKGNRIQTEFHFKGDGFSLFVRLVGAKASLLKCLVQEEFRASGLNRDGIGMHSGDRYFDRGLSRRQYNLRFDATLRQLETALREQSDGGKVVAIERIPEDRLTCYAIKVMNLEDLPPHTEKRKNQGEQDIFTTSTAISSENGNSALKVGDNIATSPTSDQVRDMIRRAWK